MTELKALISINTNKLPEVTEEDVSYHAGSGKLDYYILEHNNTVLDLNLPREWVIVPYDIVLDVNFIDEKTGDCWSKGVFLGKEADNDTEGFGTEVKFIGYLPERVVSKWLEYNQEITDEIIIKVPVETEWVTLKFSFNQEIIPSPFESVKEAVKFMTS